MEATSLDLFTSRHRKPDTVLSKCVTDTFKGRESKRWDYWNSNAANKIQLSQIFLILNDTLTESKSN